jgi:hypothetical protein
MRIQNPPNGAHSLTFAPTAMSQIASSVDLNRILKLAGAVALIVPVVGGRVA